MLTLLGDNHCFTIAQHKNFIRSWFLEKTNAETIEENSIGLDTYEYFVTINSTFNPRIYSVKSLVEQIIEYAKSIPNLITYKICADINKKGLYHGHLYLCCSEYNSYAPLRDLWKHKYKPYIVPVTNTEGLFVYMNNHAIALHNTFEDIPLGYNGPRVRLVNK